MFVLSHGAVSICSANVGYSPTLRQHFKKTAAPKNFSLPVARCLQPRLSYFDVMFCVKHSEIAPMETTRNRFGKAGAHPQLALGIAIAPEILSHHYNLSILKAIAVLPILS